MKKSELTGKAVKKALGCKYALYRYHNKNKSGGNFGFEIRGIHGCEDLEVSGSYNTEGYCYELTFGAIYWSTRLIKSGTFDEVMAHATRYIEKYRERVAANEEYIRTNKELIA